MRKELSIEDIKPKIWYKALNYQDAYLQPWYNYFFEIGGKVRYFSVDLAGGDITDVDEYAADVAYITEDYDDFIDSLGDFTFEEIKINLDFSKYLLLSIFNHEV